ncbi:MAG: hypothetical protein IJT23_08505 [Clostridia bacterium]|nr:hypothetical protein [Clostridia bacterium]
MCKLFDEWTPQIKEYCENNNLSFEKARNMSQCWSKNDVILQYYDKHNSRKDLLQDIPMPIVLKITKTDKGLTFEQTEHTKKYLTIA